MSGDLKKWPIGLGITNEDLEAAAAVAATADDLALAPLLVPADPGAGAAIKAVTPLFVRGNTFRPGLIYAFTSNGTQTMGFKKAKFAVCNNYAGDTPSIALSATTKETLSAVAPAPNSSGAMRYDLIWARLSRVNGTSVTRKVKSVGDGSVSTKSVALSTVPTVTYGITTGTSDPDGPALPSDSAGIYYVALGTIAVPDGYVPDGTTDDATLGAAITEVWTRGGVQPDRIPMPVPSLHLGADSHKATTRSVQRWGAVQTMYCAVVRLPSDTDGTTVVLDNSRDWSQRMVTIRGCIGMGKPGTAPPLESTDSKCGRRTEFSTAFVTGTAGWTGTHTVDVADGGASSAMLTIGIEQSFEALRLIWKKHGSDSYPACYDTTHGDTWHLMIQFTDRATD